MENRKYYIIGLGLLASIIFFWTTAYLLTRDGYARDEGIYVADFLGSGLWILLIGSIICFIIFISVSKIKNERLAITIASLTLLILMVFGLIIIIGWFISYNHESELYVIEGKLDNIERNIDDYVSMYTAHVADEFRRFEYNNDWIEGLYYFDAYASL